MLDVPASLLPTVAEGRDLGPFLHGAIQGALSIGFIIAVLGGPISHAFGAAYDSTTQWIFAGGGAFVGALFGVLWTRLHSR